MARTIDTDAMVAQVVVGIRKRFGSFVDREDLVNEAILWMLEHPRLMDEYLSDENFNRAGYRLRRDLTMCLERYARKEKSQQLGFDPEDEAFYAAALVAALLPAVVLGSYDPPPTELGTLRAVQDPAEGQVWHAARADVARAWQAADLSTDDRAVMVDYYVQGFTESEIAEAWEVTQSTISRRLKRCMRRIVRELGGEKPKGCPYDCECHDAILRQRPGVRSNVSGANQLFE